MLCYKFVNTELKLINVGMTLIKRHSNDSVVYNNLSVI